ncbi:MAG: VIT and VWA domain-containing protein [Terriglobia bacterium]
MTLTTDEMRGFEPVATRAGETVKLAMQQLFLMGRILPIGARLIVQHTFVCEAAKPLELIYTFPLPRDAALRRFRVSGKGFSVRSQLKPVDEAVRIYEEGIQGGHLSTLARQHADGLVCLTLGNIRPGDEVAVLLEIMAGVESHDDGIRFRFPFTLAPSYHAKAKTIAIEPGVGELELPEEEFGDLILPQFRTDASALHRVGFELAVRLPQAFKEVYSPSHNLRVAWSSPLEARVSLAQEADLPDRDLVLEVNTREPLFGATSGISKDGKGHFALIVPSSRFGSPESTNPRRIVFVLDRSGSMEGVPLQQATKAIEACLGALSERDTFGLVVFDDEVEAFKPDMVPASMEQRKAAREFLKRIGARGGTELAQGFLKAARLLGSEGGDALIVTDGQVLGTESILEKARASGIRLHCLGIGSASQDRFLALLARESGGISRFLTPRERVDLAAVDLFASIGRPVAHDVQIETGHLPGSTISPQPSSTVFAGNPLVIYGETGSREGKLLLKWQTGEESKTLECLLQFEENRIGDTVRLLRGARLITDLESQLGGSERDSAVTRRAGDRVSRKLELLSESFGLASRRMALVAVIERPSDQPDQLPETRVVPVGMPQDVSFDRYFGVPQVMACLSMPDASSAMSQESAPIFNTRSSRRAIPSIGRIFKSAKKESEDLLLVLASAIEPDGGMPGKNPEERILSSVLALLSFVEKGHTLSAGAFRVHVQRLISFLESGVVKVLSPDQQVLVEKVVELVRSGQSLHGDWCGVALAPVTASSTKKAWARLAAELQ